MGFQLTGFEPARVMTPKGLSPLCTRQNVRAIATSGRQEIRTLKAFTPSRFQDGVPHQWQAFHVFHYLVISMHFIGL
jgi:hypothetical protein